MPSCPAWPFIPQSRRSVRRRELADSDDISSRIFTLAEATAWCGLKSEKTLRRLINSRKIRAEKRTAQRKKRWVIKGSELRSYQLHKGGWFRRAFSPIPPIEGYGKHIGFSFTFGTWGKLEEGMEQVSPRAFIVHEPDRIPTFELVVSLDDLWRFVRQRPRSKWEYKKLKNELRSRLRYASENFKVRFRLDNSTLKKLERVVKSVTPFRSTSGI